MPLICSVAELKGLFTLTPPRISSGLTCSRSFEFCFSARTSANSRRMMRPARSPPACILVRPLRMMRMFWPNSFRTLMLPRWKPSPSADKITIEITPQDDSEHRQETADLVGLQVLPDLRQDDHGSWGITSSGNLRIVSTLYFL